MYICSHPQVLLPLQDMFVIFVVLYMVSNRLYDFGLSVSDGPLHPLIFSIAQWLIFRIAFMITYKIIFKRVSTITLCLCGPLRRGVFFYCCTLMI